MADDPLVKLKDGRVMTLSQYKAMVDQAMTDYTQQMTVAIEQLSRLQDQLYVHGGQVYDTLSTLVADLSGIDGAIGTDDQAEQFRKNWTDAWKGLQQVIGAAGQAVFTVGDGLGKAADAVFQAEEQTADGFNGMGMGFDFHATDPRWRPPSRRPRMF